MSTAEPYVALRPPWPSRLLGATLAGLQRLGLGRRWMEPDEIVTRARRRTGLSELGVPGFEDRTARFVESVEREASLTGLGRASVHGFMVDCASNRLRLTELLRRHPEIERIPVEAPVFIVGWPRTGTTALHDLLSLDPGLYGPPLWELRQPVPDRMERDADPADRIAQAERMVAFTRRVAPGMLAAHPLHARLPDECQFLFDNDMFTASFIAFQADAFGRWMLRTDEAEALYRSYRTQLQVLLWARTSGASRRLVLKWPFHLWHLDALTTVFPDARIVQTHRALDQALPSLCNLGGLIQGMFCDRIDPQRLGAQWLELTAEGIARGMAARDQAPPQTRFHDLVHGRLVADHVEEVARIYDGLGLPWPDDMPARIEGYLRDRPRGHVGRHHYRMEWFGLRPELIAERFAGYRERFEDRLALRT